ncbi:MAG: transmembrane anchor protein [Gemmatimonadaceae bacterium]
MSNINAPAPDSLPSPERLRRFSLVALLVAVVLTVVVVLPAERGIDPTGLGRVIGLTPMGEFKVAAAEELAQELAAEEQTRSEDPARAVVTAGAAAAPGSRSDSATLTLGPNEGKEIKLVMKKGARAEYSWSVSGGVVNYVLHGDTVNAPAGVFHSYKRANGRDTDAGVLEAVFDGHHGWFWRNRSSATVTITLRTTGAYSELREIR